MKHAFEERRPFEVFRGGESGPWAGFRPSAPCRVGHALAEHPLLAREALAQAAPLLDPAAVQIRMPSDRHGEGFPFYEGELAIDDAIRRIEEIGCWVVLGRLESLPAYSELFGTIIDAIRYQMKPHLGHLADMETFVFVSRPGTLTPFHFDPEYNILFQISGRKDFAVFPENERFLPHAINEKYYQDGDNLLPWQEPLASEGVLHHLDAGEALYVPYKVPHWVEVGEEPSISLSVTWKTPASLEQDNAWHMNAWLRGKGLEPSPPRPLPARQRVKSFAFRALRRCGLT